MKDFFLLAFNNLKRRRLRSWLTMIGIFIGIAAVVALISLGQGLQNYINEQFEQLGRYAHGAGMLFLSSAFDLESARFMGHIVDALKIASADNTFYPLISEMAKTGKPLIISSGLVNLDQLSQALYLIKTTWMEDDVNQDLAVLHTNRWHLDPTSGTGVDPLMDETSQLVGTLISHSRKDVHRRLLLGTPRRHRASNGGRD